MDEYRIEYTIQRRQSPDEQGFTDIGFGSSGAWDNIDAALYAAQSDIERRNWETEPGMPDPSTLDDGAVVDGSDREEVKEN